MSNKTIFPVVIFFMVLSYAFSQEIGFQMKAGLGLDLFGNHKVIAGGISPDTPTDLGVSIDLEAGMNIDILILGIGIESQFIRGLKDYSGSFAFFPIFAYVELNPQFEMFSPFLFGKIGYDLFYYGDNNYVGADGDLIGGLYWAAGVGVDIVRFQSWFGLVSVFYLEISYSVNCGSFDDITHTIHACVEYSKINVRFGARNTI